MKLQFLKPYPNSSITEAFDDIEINDFTVITGKNGVGKTHLLEAIVSSDNYININDGINAIYFNYNDFVVENTTTNQQRNRSQLKKKNNGNTIDQDLRNIRNKISQSIHNQLINSFRQNNQLINQVNTYILNRVNFLNIPSMDDFNNVLFNFTTDKELISEIYIKLKECIVNFNQIKDATFDKYYQKANTLNLPLSQINSSHFQYTESWLGQLLESEFKNYIRTFDTVQREIIRKNSKNITQAEIEEKTVKEVGIAPWILLNEILEKYSCNGYIIDKDLSYSIQRYQNIDQQPLNIILKNYDSDKTINLDRLSSGEKTLFALAVALYRQSKDENLPTVLLLDEIDSSLHPSMSKQLLDVLENLFVKKYNLKIIMVTHSPSTVALAPENSVYVMENDKGKIDLIKKTNAEAVQFLSDGFATLSDSKMLFENILNSKKDFILFTEGETDIEHIKVAKEKLEIIDLEFDIYSCDCADKLKQFLMGIPKGLSNDKRIIGIFDYDKEGIEQAKALGGKDSKGVIEENSIYKRNDVDNIFSITIPCPNDNFKIHENCPIEFLYPREKILPEMIEKRSLKEVNNKLKETQIGSNEYEEKTDLYFFKLTKNANKRHFSNEIKNYQKVDFENFRNLFEKIRNLKK